MLFFGLEFWLGVVAGAALVPSVKKAWALATQYNFVLAIVDWVKTQIGKLK